jgi:hypothetical protein
VLLVGHFLNRLWIGSLSSPSRWVIWSVVLPLVMTERKGYHYCDLIACRIRVFHDVTFDEAHSFFPDAHSS